MFQKRPDFPVWISQHIHTIKNFDLATNSQKQLTACKFRVSTCITLSIYEARLFALRKNEQQYMHLYLEISYHVGGTFTWTRFLYPCADL